MGKRKFWTLIAAPGLAVTSLLLLFLLLGWSTVRATPADADPMPNVQAQSPTFTVSGTVTCEVTGPISDVEVFVWNRDGSGGFTGDITDSSGAYSVRLEAGNYDLTFNPPCGHECASKGLKGITVPPDRIRNVTLAAGYTVSGTVRTQDDTPVDDVSIYAFNHETADGFGVALTDASGDYCIGLITGTYDLGFTPPPCRGLGPKTEVISLNEDTPLDVTLPPGFTVAGRVTDGASHPVSGVQIYARECYTWTGYGFSPSNADGYYTGTLPMGTFGIQFLPPANRGLGPKTIPDVTSNSPGCPNTTLNVTLPEGFTISGRVTCRVEPVKNVAVHADPPGPLPDCYDLDRVKVFSVDDGSYGLPLVSGTYILTFTPPAAARLNAKAFTTTEIIADTVLDVDFCICSGDWVSETVDDGVVGSWTSLALAPTYPYTPHISYGSQPTEVHHLKFARLSGTTWLSETVDSGGQGTSLALAPTSPYSPCISYRNLDDLSKFACWNGAGWTTWEVFVNDGPSLALEQTYPYTPHISGYRSAYGYYENLRHAYLSGTNWCSGTWIYEYVEPRQSFKGSHNSLALGSNAPYTPHISYYDAANDDLKHAWKSGTTWFSETVDSEGDVGRYTSLALDSGDNPHISYYDHTNGTLKYAWKSGTTWFSETVDSTGQQETWYGKGATSLELDRADRPYITYYDVTDDTHKDLKFARFDGKVWIIQTVDSQGDVGSYSSLALDQADCPHISYHDLTNLDLKYAYMLYYVYFPLVTRNYP
jgi:hypothetical protein